MQMIFWERYREEPSCFGNGGGAGDDGLRLVQMILRSYLS